MPKINLNDTESYGGSNVYLVLADDGDHDEVTVLANTVDDIPIYAVHKLDFGNYSIRVNCLRQPDEPVTVCPLCEKGDKPKISVILALMTSQGVRIFERGKKFIPKLQRWAKQYPLLCKPVFDLVRIGKKGDQDTSYEFERIGANGKIADWRELATDEQVQALLNEVIKDWSYEEIENYLKTGKDPFARQTVGNNGGFKARGSVVNQPVPKRQAPVPKRNSNVQYDNDEDFGEDEASEPEVQRPSKQAPAPKRQAPAPVENGDEDF